MYAEEGLCATPLHTYNYILCAGSSWNTEYLTHVAVCAVYSKNPRHGALTVTAQELPAVFPLGFF